MTPALTSASLPLVRLLRLPVGRKQLSSRPRPDPPRITPCSKVRAPACSFLLATSSRRTASASSTSASRTRLASRAASASGGRPIPLSLHRCMSSQWTDANAPAVAAVECVHRHLAQQDDGRHSGWQRLDGVEALENIAPPPPPPAGSPPPPPPGWPQAAAARSSSPNAQLMQTVHRAARRRRRRGDRLTSAADSLKSQHGGDQRLADASSLRVDEVRGGQFERPRRHMNRSAT